MKISQNKATKVIAVILLALSMLCYFVICPKYVPDITTFGVSPRAIPNFCFIVMAVLSVGLFLETHIKERSEKKHGTEPKMIDINLKGLALVLFAFGTMIAYQLVVYKVGYIITVAVILAGSMLILGQKNKIVIAACAVLIPVAYYCFFTYLLKMQMP